jgi:hypothetical protein
MFKGLEIIGKNGTTGRILIDNSNAVDKNKDLFERGKNDEFEYEALNVGKVFWISYLKIYYSIAK